MRSSTAARGTEPALGLGATEELGLRLRPLWFASEDGRQLHAFTLEAALSHSLYAGKPDFFPLDSEDRTLVTPVGVWWGQLEAGWEARFARHLQVRVASGVAELLGHPRLSCYTRESGASECAEIPRYLFTFTVGVGVAF